ncbi:MAG TPA: hypothetical protein VFQ40_05750 [Actinomycetota bacterium]|nr:hypothetical protein [Actinomycetota bacterium]
MTVAHSRTALMIGCAVAPCEHLGGDRLGKEPSQRAADAFLFEVEQALPAETRVDPSTKDRRVEGLGKEVVGTGLEASNDAVRIFEPGDHERHC